MGERAAPSQGGHPPPRCVCPTPGQSRARAPRRTCSQLPFIPPRRCHWLGDLCVRLRRAPARLTCARASAAARGRGGPAQPGELGPGLRATGLQEQPRRHRQQRAAMVLVRKSRLAAAPPLARRPSSRNPPRGSRYPEPEAWRGKRVCRDLPVALFPPGACGAFSGSGSCGDARFSGGQRGGSAGGGRLARGPPSVICGAARGEPGTSTVRAEVSLRPSC